MRANSAAVLAASFVLAAGTAAAQQKGSCVDCHQRLRADVAIRHDYADWHKSPHAAAAVNCEACHGGDASATDKDAAHKGVLRSSDPNSRIYFTQTPQTCGTCHAAELAAFRGSSHFKELQASGKGPSCVTCHGSMANVVLGSKELGDTCTLCHRKPAAAMAARRDLDASGAMVRSLGSALKKAREAGAAELAPQEKAYREIVELQRAMVVRWHAFKVQELNASNRELKRRVTALQSELKLKSPK